MKSGIVIASLAAAALTGNASAALFTYNFTLDGLQEVPPNASPALGTAVVTLDTDTNFLTWDVSFSGLTAPMTAAHFHSPAPPGVNAGVALGIAGAGGTAGNIVGSANISAAFEQHILDGLAYINIHTSTFPGGEIRGQVVPTPGAIALLGVAGLLGVRRRRA